MLWFSFKICIVLSRRKGCKGILFFTALRWINAVDICKEWCGICFHIRHSRNELLCCLFSFIILGTEQLEELLRLNRYNLPVLHFSIPFYTMSLLLSLLPYLRYLLFSKSFISKALHRSYHLSKEAK